MSGTDAFGWYELRTTDPAAAQAFYADVLGWQVRRTGESSTFHVAEQGVAGLMELPERARAQGAPAHWLGHIGVLDAEASAQRMIERGGQMLGPMRRAAEGSVAILRDPQGAVLALSSRPERSGGGAVAWHELHTTDREQAWRTYAELFGWQATQVQELGSELGGAYQMFAWRGAGAGAAGERSVGGMINTARLPHIHTHWLFYATVADLDAAVTKVRALGGLVMNGPMQVPGGDRVAQCEDPQGAAFALREQRARP